MRILRHALTLLLIFAVLAAAGIWYLSRPDEARLSVADLSGREPKFTDPRKQYLPTLVVAEAIGWKANEAPVGPKGMTVTRFAEGLDHPRSILTLPNGDVLVAETNAPGPPMEGIQGWVFGLFQKKAGGAAPSANRITLLRDADGDGKAETRSAFLTGLRSPYGMALIGDTLYVANTDSLMAFPYKTGETQIADKGRLILKLPANAPNRHWTRSLVASPDGKLLYVGVGSNSNIAEGGLDAEENRAAVLEVDPAKGSYRIFASGLRNPIGMDWNPITGDLWAVVQERDMLGSDLVPDFLTRVEFGGFYGWPWNYWGGYEDKRVQPTRPDLREYTHRPDYGLGAHSAALGLTFSTQTKLGAQWARGAFIGLHGSWNRKPAAGYSVVFVPFAADGTAQGKPVNFLTGFLNGEGQAHGRPVDVKADKSGALLVSDDVGNVIWRVSAGK